MTQEAQKEKTGGMAYEVILKPASADAVPRPMSQEFIEKKLKDAEERRQSVEAGRLALVAKDKERAQEANKRVADLNDSFSKQTELKVKERMETMAERRNRQIQAIQDNLQEHEKHAEEVRNKKMTEPNGVE